MPQRFKCVNIIENSPRKHIQQFIRSNLLNFKSMVKVNIYNGYKISLTNRLSQLNIFNPFSIIRDLFSLFTNKKPKFDFSKK